jgi:maleate cis-trans isomerase
VLVVLSTGLYYHSDVHMMCRATRVRYQVARMAKSRETVTQHLRSMSEITAQDSNVIQKVEQISSNNLIETANMPFIKPPPLRRSAR